MKVSCWERHGSKRREVIVVYHRAEPTDEDTPMTCTSPCVVRCRFNEVRVMHKPTQNA